MSSVKKACVIGCGVSGLSTAILLKEKGWDITIYSKEIPKNPEPKNPAFASLFPAASIIPHSVSSGRTNTLFKNSQDHFKQLYNDGFPGLSRHEHFELFTENVPAPDYNLLMDHFEFFDSFKESFFPKHPNIEIKHGWKFECFFADWSLYFPALMTQALKLGVDIKHKNISINDLRYLPFEYIINCSGFGAAELFKDQHKLIHRGHLVQIPGKAKLRNPKGKLISYNFSPGKEVYSSESNNPQDVYFYPRRDGWIFGGSRQEGFVDENGNWQGEESMSPTLSLSGLNVPKQVLDLNTQIIEHTFGVKIQKPSNLKAKMGYRFIRKHEDGLRLEAEKLYDKLFIHNYGHGGAGVTLSWGCAKVVLALLEAQNG